jgi:Fur family transcriptional regulator, peroxide stress response regulator
MKAVPAVLRQRLRDKGLKLTPQRYAIYETLCSTESHPTVDEIYGAIKQVFPMLSLNTVYATLSSLKEAGLIAEVPVQQSPARFDANMDQHHHLVCLGCHKIEDVYDARLDRLKLSNAKNLGYTINAHRVEFQGYCGRCQKRNKRR